MARLVSLHIWMNHWQFTPDRKDDRFRAIVTGWPLGGLARLHALLSQTHRLMEPEALDTVLDIIFAGVYEVNVGGGHLSSIPTF